MESLRPLNRAGFTDVLDYGVSLFKKHFRKIFFISLVFNLPVTILLSIFNPVLTNQYMTFMNPDEITGSGDILSSVLALYAMIIGGLLLSGIYNLTLKNVMDGSIIKILYADVVLNQEKTPGQVIRECFKQFGTMMLGRFLYGLIQSLVFFVAYILLVIGIFAGSFAFMGTAAAGFTSSSPWLAAGIIILGILAAMTALFFLVVVTGYFNGRYWMFLPAICIEQHKAGSGIGRCNKLGGNGFYLIGLSYIAGALLIWIFPGIINIVILFASGVSGNMNVELYRIGTVVTQIFSAVLQPLFVCILTALYIILRVRREGLDLEIDLWTIKEEEKRKTQRWTMEAPNAAE